ncbi:HSF-type DNA-binding protein [Nitzschia inconspicua]|uniref:HSF-type DNA-binding protein n=1 Tax=Nitzschia inconspicua TaxID=303405 RepID=A0A9K3LK60_9STRA|nr:HSF-type DNA-binding protein [Nitzschia inconspicua]
MSINKSNTYASGSSGDSNIITNNAEKIKMVIDKPNQFPWKLYDMLDTAERKGEEHIISWIRDGTAFKVHNREVFIEEYMKKQFNQTKFKSFQRQLNLWGFERVQTGPDKGSYYHPLFIKGQRECCQRLTRVRLKGAPSETKHSNSGGGGDPSTQDQKQKLPVTMPGIGSVAVGISAAGGFAAVAPSDSLPRFTPPLHGFTEPDPSRVSAIEATLRGSSQQHLLRYQQESQHRETLATSNTELGPEVASRLAPNALISSRSDRSAMVVNGLLQYERELAEQQRQQQQQEEEQQTEGEYQRFGYPREQEVKMPHSSVPDPEEIPLASIQHRHVQSNGSSARSDEMAALLAVSAQRRREEELALLLELSKPKGVDV